MSEWWTYRPEDFLMFAPRTYWRLFELHNQAAWPAPWLLLAAGWAGWWLLRCRAPPLRTLALGLALAWAAVGWFFLHGRYAAVFWVMQGAAWVFLMQALGLLALASQGPMGVTPSRPARFGGALLFGLGALGQPLLAAAAGRPWMQAEIIGLAPDPTVFATLGLLLCAAPGQGARRWLYGVLWGLALAWCAVSAATLWTMGSPQGWVAAFAGAGALALRLWSRTLRSRSQHPSA